MMTSAVTSGVPVEVGRAVTCAPAGMGVRVASVGASTMAAVAVRMRIVLGSGASVTKGVGVIVGKGVRVGRVVGEGSRVGVNVTVGVSVEVGVSVAVSVGVLVGGGVSVGISVGRAAIVGNSGCVGWQALIRKTAAMPIIMPKNCLFMRVPFLIMLG